MRIIKRRKKNVEEKGNKKNKKEKEGRGSKRVKGSMKTHKGLPTEGYTGWPLPSAGPLSTGPVRSRWEGRGETHCVPVSSECGPLVQTTRALASHPSSQNWGAFQNCLLSALHPQTVPLHHQDRCFQSDPGRALKSTSQTANSSTHPS